MALDTKVILDQMNNNWAILKAEADEAIAEAKKLTGGGLSGEALQKIDRLQARLDEVETKLNRPIYGGSATDPDSPKGQEVREKKRVYFEMLRHREGYAMLSDEDQAVAKKYGMGPITPAERKALSLGDDTTGGFLAPPEYVNDIIKGVQLISPIRGMATIRNTTRRSIMYPVRSGVFAATWVGETSTRSETTGLAYSMEEIPTYEMYAEVIVSEQDLEDSAFDLEAEIRDNAAEQFAKAEGAAFVTGDGQKKPEGYMNAPNIATDLSGNAGTIASAAAGSAGQGDGLVTCAFNLKSAYAQGAQWVLNRQSVGKVRLLKDTQGRYLWEPAYSAGSGVVNAPSILGIPYVEVPDMANEGASNFPIALGNFKRACILVDRVDMVIKRLNEVYANQGQIGFLVRKRVGFQVVLAEALRKYKSNNS